MVVGIIIGAVGGVVIGAVGAWLVLRNNPKFLFRHVEHLVEAKMKKFIDNVALAGQVEIIEALKKAKEALKRAADKIT